jgi:hypothetical protein
MQPWHPQVIHLEVGRLYPPAEYAQGAVIIDVVDARTELLLWRGHGPAAASDDEASSVKRLDQAADAILDQFPQRSLALSHGATISSP